MAVASSGPKGLQGAARRTGVSAVQLKKGKKQKHGGRDSWGRGAIAEGYRKVFLEEAAARCRKSERITGARRDTGQSWFVSLILRGIMPPSREVALLLFPVNAAVAVMLLVLHGLLCGVSAQSAELTGLVVDQKTHQPVTAASVRAGNLPEVITDQRGSFRVTGIPTGKVLVRISHLAYGERSIEVDIKPGANAVRMAIAETAIVLEPFTVDAMSNEQLQTRGAGFRRSIVTREQIARTQGTMMGLADILRVHVPTVRVRRVDRVVGSPICIELRAIRSDAGNDCQSPKVYLDGVPVSNPITLYDNLDPDMIERIEVVPASEAGVRYGTGALHGALLIETRRPGGATDEKRAGLAAQKTSFDWNTDEHGHRTALVFISAAAGNAAGLAAGLAIAKQCLRLRAPSYDGLVSDCSTAGSLASAGAAVVLPALGSALGSRLAGQTDSSRGRFLPATLGATAMLVPGYALVFTGRRNDSDSLRGVGYVVMAVGAPFVSTAADYLFRRLLD
jgi:hypothetical protein